MFMQMLWERPFRGSDELGAILVLVDAVGRVEETVNGRDWERD